MSKRKSSRGKSDAQPSETPAARHHGGSRSAAVRETIESIVIAFVAAFLVRTFEAEAFVIPTGSMAPTLMGRHKDVTCPECGYFYRVNASEEVDQETNQLTGSVVRAGTCPMCRYTATLGPDHPPYSGDRILVGKFAYELAEPQRWDVAVFKYPGDAVTNYIKRIVGLPGERLRIEHGDVFIHHDGDPPTIARKPPRKLLAMLQTVYDNAYSPPIYERGWPHRWVGEPIAGDQPGAFQPVDPEGCLVFETDGSAEGSVWLRYEHRVPSFRDWQRLFVAEDRGQLDPAPEVLPQLIADMTAYNTGRGSDREPPSEDAIGMHWVGDLALECTLDVTGSEGEAVLELIEGGVVMQCRFDVATGRATLSIDALPEFTASAETSVRGPGRHHLRFANCDDRLYLWVDGWPVTFDAPTTYPRLGNTTPTEMDLRPVAVGSRGLAMRVTDLVVRRDLYYIAADPARRKGISDFRYGGRRDFDSPARWGATHSPGFIEFTLGEDHYFALGDNSARSKDSRLWNYEGYEHFVRRNALTGKALFIYWPHSLGRVPGTQIPFPFFPNFPRMHFVE